MKPEKQLYQWDTNQSLVELTPSAQYVDYPIGNEVIRIKADGTRCRIPDEVLQTYGGKTCYERYPDGTYRAYSFTVLYAPKPPEYVYTPEERTTFEALTARVDAAIEEIKRRADSGEFTPKKGVDYFTDAEKAEMMEGVSSGAIGEFRKVVDTATAEYNNNHSLKLAKYNDNASEKLTTYDTNAEQHTSDYNRNAEQKLQAYNQNHTEKVAEYNQNAETKTAEFDSNAAALQTEVDRLRGECDTLAAENRKQENRISALMKLNKGQTYDILPEEGETASRTAPSGAKYVSVDKVGGKSLVWNQLVDGSNLPSTRTINGITFTNNGDGSITVDGTATENANLNLQKMNNTTIVGHKYLMLGGAAGGSLSTYFYMYDSNGGTQAYDYGKGAIFTKSAEAVTYIAIRVVSGVTASGLAFKPQIFDLTQMFGAGNEPSTVEEFEAMFPADYYPYSEPTIISSQTDRVDVESADGTITQQITTSFPVLNSAGSVYDYIDLNEGKLHQMVGIVDLGSLEWYAKDLSNNRRAFYSSSNICNKLNIKCDWGYATHQISILGLKSVKQVENYWGVNSFVANHGKGLIPEEKTIVIILSTDTYADATSFKEAMNGVMLYYELAEEVITDIEIPTELTDWLTV